MQGGGLLLNLQDFASRYNQAVADHGHHVCDVATVVDIGMIISGAKFATIPAASHPVVGTSDGRDVTLNGILQDVLGA